MIITDFTPDEENVAAGAGVTDPEFDQDTSQVCWQDKAGRLWVAPVDPVTGDIQLEDKVLLDVGLAPIADQGDAATGNGPEWIVSETGSDILYTKAISEDPSTWEVWSASRNGTEWETQFLVTGGSPNGSTAAGDPDPKFIFRQADDQGKFDLLWYDYDTGDTGLVTSERTKGARWVNDESDQLVFAQEVDGIRQVFLYDVDLDSTTQLTFGGTDKSKPWIWEAPERDGGLVLMTLEDGQSPQTLGIYVESGGTWTKALELRPPTGRELIYSPEPFVYDGRSGISFVAKDELSVQAESEVWLAGLGPSGPVYRQVSEPTTLARNDPETFATEEGLVVYYNVQSVRLFDNTPPSLFRASTGVVADPDPAVAVQSESSALKLSTSEQSSEQSSSVLRDFTWIALPMDQGQQGWSVSETWEDLMHQGGSSMVETGSEENVLISSTGSLDGASAMWYDQQVEGYQVAGLSQGAGESASASDEPLDSQWFLQTWVEA